MTDINTYDGAPEAEFRDFVALLKPRVMSLVVFTAFVGLWVAPVDVHPFITFCSVLFIALGGGASGALNMWYDADIDAVMKRTAGRPVPSGRVPPGDALALGIALVGIYASLDEILAPALVVDADQIDRFSDAIDGALTRVFG